MLEDEQNEVLNLPKNFPIEQPSSNGVFKKYQDRLVDQFLSVFQNFQNSTKDISESCKNEMKQKMANFQAEAANIKNKQQEILDSMSSTSLTFDELKEQLQSLSADLIKISDQIYTDIMETHKNYFLKLKPVVAKAYQSCQTYLSRLPLQHSERLPFAIKQLNESFLQNKQNLVKALYSFQLDAHKNEAFVLSEFQKREGEWKQNRFNIITENAKKQLDPLNPLDFGSIFHEFYVDQCKFTHCFKKAISNIALFSPPNYFDNQKLDEWWKEVNEIIDSHKNFISQFLSKVQEKIDERNQANSQLVSELENEINHLVQEADASITMAEIMPIYKQSQKYFSSIGEKLQNYWGNRSDSLLKGFESIHELLNNLITTYQTFVTDADENHNNVLNELDEISRKTNDTVNSLEVDLEQKSNDILTLFSKNDIQKQVEECKRILANIADEYRESYSKSVAVLDSQEHKVHELYIPAENTIISILKLKKTAESPEFEVQEQSAKSSRRTARSRRQSRPRIEPKDQSGFTIELSNGAKYEEAEPLEVIPQFDDFIDEPTTLQVDQNHIKNKGKPVPKPPRRGGATKNAMIKSSRRGKIEEPEEPDSPEVILSEIVPKEENGIISIWVYVPNNADLDMWMSDFRKSVIFGLYQAFQVRYARSSYPAEREKLRDELNEHMRLHAPRSGNIDINFAQKRIQQIDSRNYQFEKHFTQTVTSFNKGVLSIQNSLERRKQVIITEIDKLRVFIDNLPKQKSSHSYVNLEQSFKTANSKFAIYFEKQVGEINTEIENFISNFHATNERFLNSVIMNDNSFSEAERKKSSQYFDKLKETSDTAIRDLYTKRDNMKNDIDSIHNSVLEEFNSSLQCNKIDLTFLENIKQIQIDSKMKYEALLSRSKTMEAEIDILLSKVDVDNNLNPQDSLADAFLKLEEMRVAFIQRGIFLNLVKSKITADPIEFDFDLTSTEPRESKPSQGNGRASRNVKEKENQSESLKANSKDKSISQKRKGNAVKLTPHELQLQQRSMPLNQQFDLYSSEYTNDIKKKATEYYNSFKTRKLPITRPDRIPEQINELTNNCAEIWKNTTCDFGNFVKDSGLHFRTQVQHCENLSREIQIKMYQIFTNFYLDQVAKERSDAQITFEEEMNQFSIQKDFNKSLIVPKIADGNHNKEIDNVLEKENERTKNQNNLICSFGQQIYDLETKQMNFYLQHLHEFTQTMFSLFDKFLQFDDFKEGPAGDQAVRKTMKELLKEKARKETKNNDPIGRPFHTRNWPSLCSVMKPLINPDYPFEKPQSSQTKELPASSRSNANTNRRKRSAKPEVAPNVESPSPPPMMPTANSLDTSLNRGIIIERNNSYQTYENSLSQRIDNFNRYLKSIIEDSKNYTNHWNSFIESITNQK